MVAPEFYVDVNIFIYWLGNHPKFGRKSYNWIREIEGSPRGKYITSSLTIYEALVIIAGLTGNSLMDMEFVKGVVTSIIDIGGLVITPLTVEDTVEAVNLMKKYGLDYEDSLHLAIALRNRVKKIISSDRDFDNTPLRRVF